ncbi:hypothetical protein PAXRUDRAFT_827768 [Paxillus rubicundulus Ve08.2h10]|uniref:Uncharacterized protein n=1 Tax=Paxillus rubicundulus Ve08.2h10 TaxID=930991 RepID=A0A0D0E2B0_9AGAM|nr:hypothetical protein PAXRUDRAFT_827768 [Paxillus rubicundulus Ve08.2h10]
MNRLEPISIDTPRAHRYERFMMRSRDHMSIYQGRSSGDECGPLHRRPKHFVTTPPKPMNEESEALPSMRVFDPALNVRSEQCEQIRERVFPTSLLASPR